MNSAATKFHDSQQNDDSDGQRKVPRWLPISLLALTTIALTVPAVLLWRQKQALGPQTRLVFGLKQPISSPPVRRRPVAGSSWAHAESSSGSVASSNKPSTSSIPPPRRTSARVNAVGTSPATTRQSLGSVSAKTRTLDTSDSLFDGPLMTLGALGLATGAVGVAAVLGVWGVQRTLGVESVDEFAARVRQLLLSHMPALSHRIYRSPLEDDGVLPGGRTQLSGTPDCDEGNERKSAGDQQEEWTWEAAEDRLGEAFDRGGVGEWAVSAVREMEAERRAERKRRGL